MCDYSPEALAEGEDHSKMLPEVGMAIATDQERWVYNVHHDLGADSGVSKQIVSYDWYTTIYIVSYR